MLGIPKPPKRGPKPRRPIARSSRPSRVRQRDSRGALRELADDVQSLYIRCRDGWTCWVCGSKRWAEMQAAHLFAKGEHHAGRYEESNVRCLCMRCHRKYTSQPVAWLDYLLWRLGQTELDRLRLVSSQRHGPHDYVLVFLYYWRKLNAGDGWKVSDRMVALAERATKLGVLKA